jgi:hypothetical protein|tara:strand:- start:101 stop:472 length:372 start_codon:yes stop_codon:yes gene_type:complete
MPGVRKCPTCGHRIKKEDYTRRIEKKRLSRDKLTLELIDEATNSIKKNLPLDDLDIFAFFSEISEIQDIIVRKMCRRYLQENLHKRGFGLKYLTGMIKNENSAYGLKKEHERKSLDRIPPKID